MNEQKQHFLLDPEIVFLNHGSFGATPRPVFAAYQEWQRRLERQPVEFLGRQALGYLAEARAHLADFLGCQADELIYFPNPTTAVNMVVRSLQLQPGDEILTSDHEYGAMDRTWEFYCRQPGAKYLHQPVTLPLTSVEAFVESFWAGVTPRTRVIFLSHLTSPTALIFPVAEICRKARQAGILTIIDGAHAPGQIALDLAALDADIYVGACHKWLLAPKGAAFLYARPEVQPWLLPLVISWGYAADPGYGSGNRFLDYHEWQGTRDLAAFLAVPAAIEFYRQNHWDAVADRCHHLAVQTRRRIIELTGLPAICPESARWFGQMCAARLPQIDLPSLKQRLWQEYRIEVPLIDWQGQALIRISVQGYNSQADLDALLQALGELLPH